MKKTAKKWYQYLLGDVITKPDKPEESSTFFVHSVWMLRIFTYAFGLFQLIKGETALGAIIILCVLFLVAPSFFTAGKIRAIPLEIEFLLFLIVVFQFVIGEAGGFYCSFLHYDDLLHFFFPFLISIMGFTVAYALYFSGKLNVSTASMILIVILITLGIGAFWEIIEYSSDQFLLPHIHTLHRLQGSTAANANQDTMTDLIDDLFGGVVGSIIASRYILEKKYNKRFKELLKQIAWDFFRGRRKKKK